MSFQILTFVELETLLQTLIADTQPWSLILKDFFTDMMATGARHIEMTQIQRWENKPNNETQILTAKGNENRIISTSTLTPRLQASIDDQIHIYKQITPSIANYWINTLISIKTLQVKTKPIATYLFRHYSFKKQMSILEDEYLVSDYFGEVDIKNTRSYINSEIKYPI